MKKGVVYTALLILLIFPIVVSADTNVSGELAADTTWSPNGGVYVLSSHVFIPPGVTLDILPGTIVKSVPGASIIVQGGELNIEGTEDNLVVLTALADDSVGGDTDNNGEQSVINSLQMIGGIVVESGGRLEINHLEIRYSGAAQIIPGQFVNIARSALLNAGGEVAASNLKVYNHFNDGVHHDSGETHIVDSIIYGPHVDRAFVYRTGGFTVSNSSVDTDSRNYSVFNQAQIGIPDARNNYWGDSSGPYHPIDNPTGMAASIYGDVLFIPFLTEPPSTKPKRTPVIIIPGIMGTKLYEDNPGFDSLIWPNFSQIALSVTDDFLDVLKNDTNGNSINNIITGDIIRSVATSDYFDGLINKLLDLGYVEGDSLFVFPYDWRLDVNELAISLNNKIEEIKNQTGANKIDIVAHSMGGLLTKSYLYNLSSTNNDIRKFIDIGTPHSGSSAAFKTFEFGDDLNIRYLFGFFNLNSERIKIISQNMPSIYQLLPTREYFEQYTSYLSDLDDIDSNGIKGNLNYDQTKQFMVNDGRNSFLLNKADELHQVIANLDPADYGIETYNIIGCGIPTLGKIFVLNKELSGGVEYNISYINGDGTVPIKSAEAIQSLEKYYVSGIKHALMPSAPGVKELVASILSEDDEFDINQYSNLSNSSNGCDMPNGRIISFHSPIDLHIYDTDGNHVGPNKSGDIEYSIPGVDYEIIDHNKFAFLPDGVEYIVKGSATDNGSFNARIQTVESGEVVEMKYFNDVPLTLATEVEIVSDTIELDTNGDQAVDQVVPPSSTLDEEQSGDLVDPITTILIEGKKKDPIEPFNKPVKISFAATDDNAGVLKTEYSLNNGQGWVNYTEPLTIGTKGDNKILYKSTDKAGNIEAEKSVIITIKPSGNKK